jgi:hypothetical protein
MSTHGRIWFHDNPWPNGHAVSEFVWSGRLDENGRLWLDLHLETVDYKSEEPPTQDLDDDWHSPIVWCNYHSCTLSSTEWADDGSTGFFVGDQEHPLTWKDLTTRQLTADATSDGEPYDFETHQAFLIYLTGHDGVADHKLSISPAATPNHFDLEWTGRVALAYGGDMELSHTFRAQLPAASFAGFTVDDNVSDDEAWARFREACTDANQFELVSREKGGRVFRLSEHL